MNNINNNSKNIKNNNINFYNNNSEETGIGVFPQKNFGDLELIINESNIYWLNWKKNSCRFDCFFFIYNFLLRNYINEINLNEKITYINTINEELRYMSKNKAKSGFYEILKKLSKDNNFNILCNYKKYEFDSIVYLFNYLNNNKTFCITYSFEERCINCLKNNGIKNGIYSSYITITYNLLYKLGVYYDLGGLIKEKISFSDINCIDCEKKYSGVNSFLHRKLLDINYPKILTFIFDLENQLGMYEGLEKAHYYIVEKLEIEFKILNYLYELKGAILIPEKNHYSACLFNYSIINENVGLLKGRIYYYDGLKSINIFEVQNNWKDVIKKFIPYCLIYIKKE